MFDRVLKKDYLLLGATILLFFVSYRFAFSVTLSQWRLHRQLAAKLAGITTSGYNPGYLIRKNANLNKVIGLYEVDTALFRDNSIYAIARVAHQNGVRLINVPSRDKQPDSTHTAVEEVELEGSYKSLLQTANALEHVSGIGRVRSETITKKRMAAGDTYQTVLEVILETVGR